MNIEETQSILNIIPSLMKGLPMSSSDQALRPDHPNAVMMNKLYRSTQHVPETETQEEAQKRVAETMKSVGLPPNFVIHTGGVKLAATGGMDFMKKYSARRGSLCDRNVVPLEVIQVIANDTYGIVVARFQTSRNGQVWERVGVGAWRFEDGVPVEHWELANGPKWDAFFLGGDPEFKGTAEEFWTKAS
jgi:hypothetical protein